MLSKLCLITSFALFSASVQGRFSQIRRANDAAVQAHWRYSSLGCFVDSTSNRVLRGLALHEDDMTVPRCQAYCSGLQYEYSGVEFGRECYCDWTFARPQVSQSCNMPCVGDSTQTTICGGSNAIEIFANLNNSFPIPKPQADIANVVKQWEYVGCYTDDRSDRTFERMTPLSQPLTPQACAKACQDSGFTFAGMEIGTECHCGKTIGGKGVEADYYDCGMECAGDPSLLCGAADRLSVYRRGTD